jgi:hypothetical protein
MLHNMKSQRASEGGVGSLTLILRREVLISCPRCHTTNAKYEPLERVHTLVFLSKEKFNTLLSNKNWYRCTVCGNQIEI